MKIEIPEGYEAKIVGNEVVLEPKESEDEKIRKDLISFVNKYYGEETKKPVLSWLEKQKELESGEYGLQKKAEEWNEKDEYIFKNIIELLKCDLTPVSNKSAVALECITWLNTRFKSLSPQPNQEWSEEDEKIARELLEYAKDEIRSYNNMVSGDYDSRDKEDKKMHEWWEKVVAYLEKQKDQKFVPQVLPCSAAWFEDGEEFGQKDQKPAEWSKEDREMKRKILKYLSTRCDVLEYEEIENWLNNPRPKPHWRPSDEQIRPLEYAIDYFKKKKNDTTYLESLLNDLKNL